MAPKRTRASAAAEPSQPSKRRKSASASATAAAQASYPRTRSCGASQPTSQPRDVGSGGKGKAAAKGKAQGASKAKAASPRKGGKRAMQQQAEEQGGASSDVCRINRAPVLTLWAAVVAQRQGYSWDASVTFGKLVSGYLAQSKGKSLGIYEERERSEEEQARRARRDAAAGVQKVDVFGMRLPSIQVGGERHAASGGKPIDPAGARGYLQRAFGVQLPAVKDAMEELAGVIPPSELGRHCYKLYERFRPAWAGWGQKGELRLSTIRGLARTWRTEA